MKPQDLSQLMLVKMCHLVSRHIWDAVKQNVADITHKHNSLRGYKT